MTFHLSRSNENDFFWWIPRSCVYNRRWDCSVQYLSAKNLRTVCTDTSVSHTVGSVFVLERLVLTTRLEAVSLTIGFSSFFLSLSLSLSLLSFHYDSERRRERERE